MKAESTRTARYVYGIRALGGGTVALVFALGCAACFRSGLSDAACIGMVFPAALSGVPYWVLERMIRNGTRRAGAQRIILGVAAAMSLAAWWAYVMVFVHPDAQGGMVFYFVPAIQLAVCAVLAIVCPG